MDHQSMDDNTNRLLMKCLELTKRQQGGDLLVDGKAIHLISCFLKQKGFVQAGTDFCGIYAASDLMTLVNENDVFVRLMQVSEPRAWLAIDVHHFRDIETKQLIGLDSTNIVRSGTEKGTTAQVTQ